MVHWFVGTYRLEDNPPNRSALRSPSHRVRIGPSSQSCITSDVYQATVLFRSNQQGVWHVTYFTYSRFWQPLNFCVTPHLFFHFFGQFGDLHDRLEVQQRPE
jgi:hypothetical protein